ncbi:hypothetical protein GGS21DRAFT_532127 [Xylaria nigripes]|nr:hypothetical protein GGS21DRAFT_532127 [Xylaria nigripes]
MYVFGWSIGVVLVGGVRMIAACCCCRSWSYPSFSLSLCLSSLMISTYQIGFIFVMWWCDSRYSYPKDLGIRVGEEVVSVSGLSALLLFWRFFSFFLWVMLGLLLLFFPLGAAWLGLAARPRGDYIMYV